jgi:hypothetical protein
MSQVLTNAKVAADTIVFTITKGKINFDPNPVQTHPGGRAHFTIRNDDAVGYKVRIPFAEFQPYGNGPRNPIDEPASGAEGVNVEANGTDALTYIIKPAAHFPFSSLEKATFRYKYTLHYADTKSNVDKPLDPDLEVS